MNYKLLDHIWYIYIYIYVILIPYKKISKFMKYFNNHVNSLVLDIET